MKKFFIFVIVIFGCSVYAQPEKIAALSSKVILENTNGYFVLSDGSLWKAAPFVKRWRSVSEWWNNVQLVPKSYECVPKDWYLGTEIEVFSKYDHMDVDIANASNQEILKQATHLLTNTRTGQVLFAIKLQPSECLVQLFNDASSDGFTKGYAEGRLNSYKDAKDIYNTGYSDGYKVGYTEGYQNAFVHD